MIRVLTSVASNMFQVAVQVSNPHDVLVELLKMKEAFPDLLLFLQIVLTVPIASASAERSFSTIKRVKTLLRSTMSDQRLNDLCLLAIEHEMSHDLPNDPSSVITKFAMLAERRLTLIK
jgi:hAT family C-terminal dimerisation region